MCPSIFAFQLHERIMLCLSGSVKDNWNESDPRSDDDHGVQCLNNTLMGGILLSLAQCREKQNQSSEQHKTPARPQDSVLL